MASKKGRPAPKSAWKPGQSGNPGGRPKIVQDFVGQKALELAKQLYGIASSDIINYDLKELGVKPGDQNEEIPTFEFQKRADRLKAMEMLFKLAGTFPRETKDINVISELDDNQLKSRILQIQAELEPDEGEELDEGEE